MYFLRSIVLFYVTAGVWLICCCSLDTFCFCLNVFFFFFKQKTAYEMRISDWSSDVCSSDLRLLAQSRLFRHGAARLRIALRHQRIAAGQLVAFPILFRRQAVSGQMALQGLVGPAVDQAEDAIGRGEAPARSDERRVGKECVSTCRSRWRPSH